MSEPVKTVKLKITQRDIQNMKAPLQSIGAMSSLSATTTFRISRLISYVTKEWDAFNQIHQDLVRKYGQQVAETDSWSVKPENLTIFTDEIEKVQDEPVVLNGWTPLHIDDFAGATGITPINFGAIYKLFDRTTRGDLGDTVGAGSLFLTRKEVVEMENALVTLGQSDKFSPKTAFNIARIIHRLKREFVSYLKRRTELTKQFGSPVDGQPDHYQIPSGKAQLDFTAAHDALLAEVINISNWKPLSLETDFASLQFSPATYAGIAKLLDAESAKQITYSNDEVADEEEIDETTI